MGLKQIYEFTEESTFDTADNYLIQSTVADSTYSRISGATVKAGIKAASIHSVSTNYTMTDGDGYDRVEADTTSNDCLLMLPTFTDNYGRIVEANHLLDGSNNFIIQGEEANKLSGDAMNQIYLPKGGDNIILYASSYSSYWEVVGERISCQFRLSEYAGFGAVDTMIMQFANVDEQYGNLISENHPAYSTLDAGLEITINRSGVYAFSFSVSGPGGGHLQGFSLNSAQLNVGVQTINSTDRLAIDAENGDFPSCAAWSGYLSKNDIIRPHTAAQVPGTTQVAHFTVTYSGS